jgi:hypothetical protein
MISIKRLITYLGQKLKGYARLLHGDHYLVQPLGFSSGKLSNGHVRLTLEVVHFADGISENLREALIPPAERGLDNPETPKLPSIALITMKLSSRTCNYYSKLSVLPFRSRQNRMVIIYPIQEFSLPWTLQPEQQ